MGFPSWRWEGHETLFYIIRIHILVSQHLLMLTNQFMNSDDIEPIRVHHFRTQIFMAWIKWLHCTASVMCNIWCMAEIRCSCICRHTRTGMLDVDHIEWMNDATLIILIVLIHGLDIYFWLHVTLDATRVQTDIIYQFCTTILVIYLQLISTRMCYDSFSQWYATRTGLINQIGKIGSKPSTAEPRYWQKHVKYVLVTDA